MISNTEMARRYVQSRWANAPRTTKQCEFCVEEFETFFPTRAKFCPRPKLCRQKDFERRQKGIRSRS